MSRKAAGDNKKTSANTLEPGMDPLALLKNYVWCCKNTGIEPNAVVRKALLDTENPNYGKQIVLSCTDEEPDKAKPKLGADGCRALCVAINGGDGGSPANPDVKPIVYKALKELRLWQCGIGDDGAVAVADLLRLAGSDIPLSFLELMSVSLCTFNFTYIGVFLETNFFSRAIIRLCIFGIVRYWRERSVGSRPVIMLWGKNFSPADASLLNVCAFQRTKQ